MNLSFQMHLSREKASIMKKADQEKIISEMKEKKTMLWRHRWMIVLGIFFKKCAKSELVCCDLIQQGKISVRTEFLSYPNVWQFCRWLLDFVNWIFVSIRLAEGNVILLHTTVSRLRRFFIVFCFAALENENNNSEMNFCFFSKGSYKFK